MNRGKLEILQYATLSLINRFKLNNLRYDKCDDLEIVATDINVYIFQNNETGLKCLHELKSRADMDKNLLDQESKLNENAVSSLELNKILIYEKIKQFSSGKEHVLLLGSRSRRVYSFGIGTKGQLGHTKIENCFQPMVIDSLKAEIESISTGNCGWHSAAIDTNGKCYIWGWNSHGQLGIDDDSAFIPNPNKLCVLNELTGDEVKFKGLSMGSKHTVLMDLSGNMYFFGWNKYKQLYEPDGDEIIEEGEMINQIDDPLKSNQSKFKDVKCGCWFTLTLRL